MIQMVLYRQTFWRKSLYRPDVLHHELDYLPREWFYMMSVYLLFMLSGSITAYSLVPCLNSRAFLSLKSSWATSADISFSLNWVIALPLMEQYLHIINGAHSLRYFNECNLFQTLFASAATQHYSLVNLASDEFYLQFNGTAQSGFGSITALF